METKTKLTPREVAAGVRVPTLPTPKPTIPNAVVVHAYQWGVSWFDSLSGESEQQWYANELAAREVHANTRGNASLVRRPVTYGAPERVL